MSEQVTEKFEALKSTITLGKGSHATSEKGMCAMEFAAYLANEPHSDQPKCVDPVIRTLMTRWNDRLPTSAKRNEYMLDLIPLTVGTAGSAELSQRRRWVICDWLFRELLPSMLELNEGTKSNAAELRALPAVNASNVAASRGIVYAAREAARKIREDAFLLLRGNYADAVAAADDANRAVAAVAAADAANRAVAVAAAAAVAAADAANRAVAVAAAANRAVAAAYAAAAYADAPYEQDYAKAKAAATRKLAPQAKRNNESLRELVKALCAMTEEA